MSSSQGDFIVRIGGEMHDGINTVKMRDPLIVKDPQIRDNDFVVVTCLFIDQDQVVEFGPGGAKLAADIAGCACDQNGSRFFFDQLGEQLVGQPAVVVFKFVVECDFIELIIGRNRAGIVNVDDR